MTNDDGVEPNRKPVDHSRYTYFLHVQRERIVGLLATEKITQAFVVTQSGAGKATPANLGIHLMWVHAQRRGQGIATKLVNVARERSLFGYTSIAPHRVAFSSPTQAGLGFARGYMGRYQAPILIYEFSSEGA